MILVESNYETQSICEEAAPGKKNWYISGIFLQANINNRNKRNYPQSVMESAVGRYNKEFVKTKRSIGELNHPSSLSVNPERASHIIESITQDGSNFIGKARILTTPMGEVVKGLLEGGVQLGVSSRGAGSVVPENGIDIVQPDFNMSTIDIVWAPSANEAFVQGLMEGHDFVWNTIAEEDKVIVEAIKTDIKKTNINHLQEAKMQAWQKFMTLLVKK